MAQHIRDLGSFESIQQVWTALPGGGMEGDYLTINGNPFAWNKFIRQWQNDTTVINNPARETQTHDGDMNIGNDARIGGNLVVIGNIINDSIKNGLSAFELAVKGGYQGTEEQWLNSLIGKSAYQIWLEQAGNAGKGIEYFLAWMKDTKAIKGPKYIEDENLIDTVNDRMTIFYVNNGTSYKVVFVDELGGKHDLANRIGDITNYAGIYDVSADNELDGGILKPYGSLPEAIADIDDNAKKAGMTIKFIQGTGADAKYVQYRLLRTTFPSTYSVDDWVLSELPIENTSDADLEFSDNDGNILARYKDGHHETKYWSSDKSQQNTGERDYNVFSTSSNYAIGDIVLKDGLLYKFTSEHDAGDWDDSEVEQTSIAKIVAERISKIGLFTVDTDTGDFEVSDNNGNVVFQVGDGHARTKHFDSRNIPQSFNYTDVKALGAKGDGIFDDTTWLQLALEQSGTIYIPNGVYRITSALVFYSNTHIMMAPNAEIKQFGGNAKCVLRSDSKNTDTEYNGVHDVTIEGGRINANGVENSAGMNAGSAIGLLHCKNIKFVGVRFYGVPKEYHHVDMSASKNVIFDKCVFDDTHRNIYSGDYKWGEIIQIDAAYNNTSYPYISISDGSPIYDQTGCEDITITNCTFLLSKYSPCVGNHNPYPSKNIRISGNYIYGPGSNSISKFRGAIAFAVSYYFKENNKIKPNMTDMVMIDHNYIYDCMYGLDLNGDSTTHVYIKDNIFVNVGAILKPQTASDLSDGAGDCAHLTDNIEISNNQ